MDSTDAADIRTDLKRLLRRFELVVLHIFFGIGRFSEIC